MEIANLPAGRVLLLGPLQVIRNGAQLPQPPSRKVRALLAYLAMAPRPISREKLCELLWDVADNPRSELRWCLSKLRPLVDGPTAARLIADRKQVWIDTCPLRCAEYAEDADHLLAERPSVVTSFVPR
jgi:DNA-binding SARP family transcriptional activator